MQCWFLPFLQNINNGATEWRWVPWKSKGFHLWQSHHLDGKSYALMAGKPVPSSHELPCQQTQAPVTLIYQWQSEREGVVGKYMIQRLNEVSDSRKWCAKHVELMQAYGWPLQLPDLATDH